jgi:hypothetical protein
MPPRAGWTVVVASLRILRHGVVPAILFVSSVEARSARTLAAVRAGDFFLQPQLTSVHLIPRSPALVWMQSAHLGGSGLPFELARPIG